MFGGAGTAGRWTIDPAHSGVAFAVRHLMGRVRGWFKTFSGEIVNAEDSTLASVTGSIDMSSVDTGNAMRDGHRRSAYFFDVDRAPTMTFASTGMGVQGQSTELTGHLTIRQITRPVVIAVNVLGLDPTGLQGEARIGFEGHATISRRDFGICFGLASDSKVVIGDQVDVHLAIETVAAG